MDPSRKQTPQGPWRWDAEGLEQVAVAYGTAAEQRADPEGKVTGFSSSLITSLASQRPPCPCHTLSTASFPGFSGISSLSQRQIQPLREAYVFRNLSESSLLKRKLYSHSSKTHTK